jgi:ElaB/YqjD/DUF883 family membrane-anchored ribosome-binding protein
LKLPKIHALSCLLKLKMNLTNIIKLFFSFVKFEDKINLFKLRHQLRLYQQLKEEIASIKANTPLIEEKCGFEENLRQKIDTTQKDLDELLSKARDRLKETQDRADAANTKAAKEREAYQAELNAAKWELNKAKLVN